MRPVVLTTLVLLSLPPAVAAQNSELFTAQDVFDVEYVQDPQISPDGSRIVFVRQFADIQTDRRYSNLWIMDGDGSNQRPLTSGKQNDASPRWSPDGSRLLYLSNTDGSTQVHVRWMDTGETSRITEMTRAPRGPIWSPDGRWIAFSSFVVDAGLQLVTMPAAPDGAEWAEPARVIDELVHRFDGVGDLEHGYTQLFVMPAAGGTPRQITSGEFHHGGFVGRSGSGQAVWSRDSQSLLVTANRHPDWELENRNTEVYQVTLDGDITQLTDRQGPDGGIAISADGERIAYVGFDDRYQGYQVSQITIADRDGSGGRVTAASLDRSARSLQWAPDADRLYFMYDDEGNTKVAYVEPGSDDVHVVAEDVGGAGSAYAGGSYAVGPNGAVVYTYSTPSVLSELAIASDRAGGRVVTDVNSDVFGHKTLGEVEEIWWESSHDGRPVQGWIIKPPNFEAGRTYPMILEIHGGPFANYGDRFDIEKQAMAAEGYVVFYPNPRGSTSYGEEFGNLIHHAYPGYDYDDLDSGVDAVVAQGYVDPDQLYITGGSGGGVLSSWTIGKTDRYRAAAVLYPVINWYSFAVTSDIPITVSKYWFPDMPWENPEHYHERSPISLVGNVTTPTMVMTGVEDYRTPMSESDQYYQALKLEGVEAVLVKMPGEPHGLRVRPSHYMQKIMYIVGWFNRYRMST